MLANNYANATTPEDKAAAFVKFGFEDIKQKLGDYADSQKNLALQTGTGPELAEIYGGIATAELGGAALGQAIRGVSEGVQIARSGASTGDVVLAEGLGGAKSGKSFLTPKQLNEYKNQVLSNNDIEFANKNQAMEFVNKKFGSFPEEVAQNRSAEGWHFDSHPINGSEEAIEHINLYSKEMGFRVHITWRK